ncbi:MAG: YfiT family bacillithiol transferase [Acidobacteriaceae bacterium]
MATEPASSSTTDDAAKLEKQRYPVGRFERPARLTHEQRSAMITTLEGLPAGLRALTGGLSDAQLERHYRPGGWTVRQLVHHVADSHLNAYARMRLALTEASPAIKPYDESKWAELEDARTLPVAPSLALLEALHQRWVVLLRSLDDRQWMRTYRHPEMGEQTMEQVLALYDWHSRHHLGHARTAVSAL